MIPKEIRFSDQDFRFSEELGYGGFATVYRAECLNNKIPEHVVAIKKIQKESFRRKEQIVKEFKIHSRLNHPNIIKLYGKYEDRKFVYLILELCSKGSLEDYLKRKGRLKEAEACKFFKHIVQGIKYLHQEKLVIHRDIALKNILLSENKTAKLADFGLSVEVNHANDARTTFSGTPFYMSPEVVMKESHTLKRDCWSLGCVLYTLLVGKSPFDGQCPAEVFTNVIMQDLTFPDDMSREAKEIISCLLEKEDSKRPGIEDILKFDFFKKHEKDLMRKCYRNGDSGTGSMGSSAMSCSRTSHPFNKTSDSGMHSTNSGSADLRWNSENAWKNKFLDTIESSGVSCGSKSKRKDERSLISNRESSQESRSRPLVRVPNMLPDRDYVCNSKKVHEGSDSISSFRSLSRIQSATRKDDHQRSASKEKYQNGSLKDHPRHYSSERGNESCRDYNYEHGVPEERSKHREGSGHCIDHIVGENKEYGKFTSSPYGSAHVAKSRSKNNSYLHSYCSNSESCKDPNCRFGSPHTVDDNHKEYLPSCRRSNDCKAENTVCSHALPTESCKTKSLSDITEPLNTRRLSHHFPIRKMVRKDLVISISKEGRVIVEHLKKKFVSLIFKISPDGKEIFLYKPKEKSKVSDKPLISRNLQFIKGYRFENFPEEYFKFYVLSKKIVDIVRAKTVKVICNGKKGKCVMMENGPYPDFHMEFPNGGMIKKTSNKISYIYEKEETHLLFSNGKVDKKYENIWKDFLMMQERCKHLEEFLNAFEEDELFPFISGNAEDYNCNHEKVCEEEVVRSLSRIQSATRKDDHKRSASKEKYQNSHPRHYSSEKANESRPENVLPREKNKESLRSQSSSLSFQKNDENRTLPDTQVASNYNHVPLENNNRLIRSIDEIMEKLDRKPEVVEGEIIAQYFDGYQLRCSKDGINLNFYDPCNRKIEKQKWNPTLKRRLQQDLLGILVYIGEENEKRNI